MTAQDIIFGAVALFVTAIFFIAVFYIGSTLNTKLLAHPSINNTQAVVSSLHSMQTKGFGMMDYIFFAMMLAIFIGVIITAWFISGHPIFMILYLIIWMVSVILSSVLVYVFDIFSTTTIFQASISAFPIMENVTMNLPIYIGILGFIGVIIIYAKPTFTGDVMQ